MAEPMTTAQIIKRLEAIDRAVGNILGPSHAAMRHPLQGDQGACPHGNIPFYPTHARWCDECWEALDEAGESARALIVTMKEVEVLAEVDGYAYTATVEDGTWTYMTLFRNRTADPSHWPVHVTISKRAT